MLLFGSLFDSAISGVIPAFGVLVGGAAVGWIRNRRKQAEDGKRASTAETSHLAETVKEMNDFMVGAPATPFRPKTPGFIERFDTLETKVGDQGSKLDTIQQGVDTLLKNGNH